MHKHKVVIGVAGCGRGLIFNVALQCWNDYRDHPRLTILHPITDSHFRVSEQAEETSERRRLHDVHGLRKTWIVRYARRETESSYLLRGRVRPDGADRGSSVHPLHLLYSSNVIQALLTEST